MNLQTMILRGILVLYLYIIVIVSQNVAIVHVYMSYNVVIRFDWYIVTGMGYLLC